jgi:hypothetical protein
LAGSKERLIKPFFANELRRKSERMMKARVLCFVPFAKPGYEISGRISLLPRAQYNGISFFIHFLLTKFLKVGALSWVPENKQQTFEVRKES